LIILLLAYLVLATAYSLASPLYEPTDEIRHFRYVRHLAVYHDLPVQRADAPRAQSHHPPLYYALGALVSGWVPVAQDVYYEPPANPFWTDRYDEVSGDNKNQYLHGDDERFPFHGVALAVYLVRWLTVLIGAAAVWVTYRIGREIFPRGPLLAVGAAALVAFNPQFLCLSGAVNNDIPAALCGAAVLWACVRLVRDGPSPRADVTLGLLYGLALLTKFHLLALFGVIELAYALAAWRARDWRGFLRGNLIVLGLAAAIAGWWFVRNWQLYGDPTGMSKVNELWIGRPATGNWWAVRQGLPYLWESLWGRFGYGQVPLPQVIYQVLLVFCVAALAGYLVPGIVRRLTIGFFTAKAQSARRFIDFTLRSLRLGGSIRLLLVITPVIFTFVVFYYMMIQPAGAMGRFLFPALPAFALLLMGGLSRYVPRRLNWAAGLAVTVGMVALGIYGLVGVLAPAFARPRPLSQAAIAAVPNPANADLGGVARLLGYRVIPTVVEPGGTVEVTLYWQPLARTEQNYAVFVHLLSDVGTMVAQRDTYPGLGSYPTTVWRPGVAFADTYRVHVPETAYAPDAGYIQVGLYLPDGPRLTTRDGRDAVRLASIEIRPRPGEFPNPLNVNFGGRVALAGYTLDRRVVHPGETIHLTLYWKALAPMQANYAVFVHVLGAREQVWSWSDGWPVEGRSPTSLWHVGDVVQDVRTLTIGETAPPDFYDVEVGVYTVEEGRLPLVAEDGHWLADRVLLGKIRVIEKTD
jgi:4-amino-4-deoxy-L-arabinose transferase-like glycosyltransferase